MQLLTALRLSELIGPELITARPSLTVSEALDLTRHHAIHHLPVVDGDALVGFVCTCDLRAGASSSEVRALMRTPAVTLHVDSTAEQAAELMTRHSVGSVVVMSENRPVGIVTRGDLVRRAPDTDALTRCQCCGMTRHLSTNRFEQTLCVYCHERSQPDDWFEVGGRG